MSQPQKSMQVTLHPKLFSQQRLQHPWVFRGGIKSVNAERAGVVTVLSPQGKSMGEALYSPKSQIALRWLTRGKEKWSTEMLHDRLQRAYTLRQKLFPKEEAYRLVFGESDGLPSLITDRFGGILVLQSLSAGMETLKETIIHWLQKNLKPKAIIERGDVSVREKEGLSQVKQVLWGEDTAETTIKILGKSFVLRPMDGQKTGFFLDQRFHAALVAPLLSGHILDAFSYSGQFAIHAADFAKSIHCVDQSAEALSQVQANAKLNDCSDKISTQEANVFDVLKELNQNKKSFDSVLLDPPAFVKSRAAKDGALRGYKEINLRALKLIKPGGFLVSSSCSQNLSRGEFLDTLQAAAVDAHRSCQILMELTQPGDHPRLLNMPETEYLKSFVLKVN